MDERDYKAMNEELNIIEPQQPAFLQGAVMRSAFEIEERLRCALAGFEHSKECGDIETAKEYQKDAGVLFWVLGRSGSYEYKDGKITLCD